MITEQDEREFCHAWTRFYNRLELMEITQKELDSLFDNYLAILDKWGWEKDSCGHWYKREKGDEQWDEDLMNIVRDLERKQNDKDYSAVDVLLRESGECIQNIREEIEEKWYSMPDDEWIRFLKWVTDESPFGQTDCDGVKREWERWRVVSISESIPTETLS